MKLGKFIALSRGIWQTGSQNLEKSAVKKTTVPRKNMGNDHKR